MDFSYTVAFLKAILTPFDPLWHTVLCVILIGFIGNLVLFAFKHVRLQGWFFHTCAFLVALYFWGAYAKFATLGALETLSIGVSLMWALLGAAASFIMFCKGSDAGEAASRLEKDNKQAKKALKAEVFSYRFWAAIFGFFAFMYYAILRESPDFFSPILL